MGSFDKVTECVEDLKEKFAAEGLLPFQPELSVICDAELSGLLEGLEGFSTVASLPYSTLLGPLQSVDGRLLAGWLDEKPLLLLLGRIHPHNGFSLAEAGFPSRMCRLLGSKRLLICTKASSLSCTANTLATTTSSLSNTNHSSGAGAQLVIIKDHLNFSGLGGRSALAGQNDPRFGPRYFPLVDAYSPAWREATACLATSLGLQVRWWQPPNNQDREGVSAEVGAPHEVTPMELVMLARMGATVMGKGSVAEVLTGVHAGMDLQVLALVHGPREESEERKISHLLSAICGKAGLGKAEG